MERLEWKICSSMTGHTIEGNRWCVTTHTAIVRGVTVYAGVESFVQMNGVKQTTTYGIEADGIEYVFDSERELIYFVCGLRPHSAEVQRLRALCLRNGIDPETGRKGLRLTTDDE